MKMSIRVRMTKRQSVAAAKREAILSSRAFREWWDARLTFSPTPSDPYRAYMIDLGLFARVHHKRVWKHRTNRMDYPNIDLPLGTPRRRRKLPPRKQIKRFKPVPKAALPAILTPYEKELVREAEQFKEKYHLPAMEIRFERGVVAAHIPAIYGRGAAIIKMPREQVEQAAKLRKGVEQQVRVVLGHELGHFAHAAYGGIGRITQKPTGLAAVITAPYVLGGTRKEVIAKEEIAWAIARKHLKGFTPIQAWGKKTWLGTYLGTTPLF